MQYYMHVFRLHGFEHIVSPICIINMELSQLLSCIAA